MCVCAFSNVVFRGLDSSVFVCVSSLGSTVLFSRFLAFPDGDAKVCLCVRKFVWDWIQLCVCVCVLLSVLEVPFFRVLRLASVSVTCVRFMICMCVIQEVKIWFV